MTKKQTSKLLEDFGFEFGKLYSSANDMRYVASLDEFGRIKPFDLDTISNWLKIRLEEITEFDEKK